MFKLAHISDLHLGPIPQLTWRELASKRLTGYLNWQRNRRKSMFGAIVENLLVHVEQAQGDHLAITGDLINLATHAEIENARLWLEALGKPEDTTVVPGNHDAYVPGALAEVSRAWYPWMKADGKADCKTPRTEPVFPFMRVRGPVAIIGVSTAIATPPPLASGYFGPDQARRTAQLLAQAGEANLFRVVLIHHPPVRGAIQQHKRLFGIDRFAATLAQGGGELVLHGHTHLNTVHWIDLPDRRVPVVGIASASQAPGARRPASSYNMFSISGGPDAWRLSRDLHVLKSMDEGFCLERSDRFLA